MVFFSEGNVVGYAWNSSLIDGTGILRSIVAIGRDFRFLNEINLSALPWMTHNNVRVVIGCLELTESNCFFLLEIL